MTTIDNYRVSPLISLANWFGNGLNRIKLAQIDLKPESLKAAAERETGLSDWGSDDFWPGYDVLFRALDADDTQTLIGRLSLRMEGLRRLKNKLLLEQALKLHPEILDQPIRRPLFIVGFPRTGTTMLHRLLCQDPRVQVPEYWKLYTPLPMNVPQSEIDRRIKSAARLQRFADFIAPQWGIIHSTGTFEPEECVYLLTDNLTYVVRANIPAYVEQFLNQDHTPVYENFKQHLQALQWEQPNASGAWVLKSPLHLWSMDALLKVFPDARIVQTHRDAKKAFPSWCSLVAALDKMERKSVDLDQVGAVWLDLWQTGIERAKAARAHADSAQFFDVQYTEQVADPMEVVHQIYDYFGDELTSETEAGMREWLSQHGSGRHFSHRYTAEEYGLTNAEIEQAFQGYMKDFDIRRE